MLWKVWVSLKASLARRSAVYFIVVLLTVLPLATVAQVATTTVQGTIYEANGQPASGTMLIQWPAFVTSGNQAVAAGNTSVTIGADGFVTVNLAANEGGYPAGTYYTVVYHLSDGTVNTEYWVVPAAASASIASVRAQTEPATVAVQSVSKSYVDSSLASLTGAYVPITGGTMTGPLTLAGDPTSDLQAATKRYADSLAASDLPLTGGKLQGALQVPDLVEKGPRINVEDTDFGAGQPVASVVVTSGACTSNPTVTISAPTYTSDGSQAKATGYCINGETKAVVKFPGGGYSSATCSVSGGGTSSTACAVTLLGTAGAADPTGTADSTAAIQNAIDFAYDNGSDPHTTASVYLPQGEYSVSHRIFLPCDEWFYGDGPSASVLSLTDTSEDGVIVAMEQNHPDAWDCRGGMQGIDIHAARGADYTATELLNDGSVGYTMRDVTVAGGGGRGWVTTNGAERSFAENMEVDTVRWPVILDGNENHVIKLNVASPGMADSYATEPDGTYGPYCYATGNCVNGAYPDTYHWKGGALEYASASGSTATFYVHSANSSYLMSPIIAGMHFTVTGTTGTSLDGLYTATSVTNNVTSDPSGQCSSSNVCFEVQGASSLNGTASLTPPTTTATFSSGAYTITVADATGFTTNEYISGAGIPSDARITAESGTILTISGATTAAESGATITGSTAWFPTIMSNQNNAVNFGGADLQIMDGSIKALQYSNCIQDDGTFGSSVSGLYCEGYTNAVTASTFRYGGDPPYTKLTSPLSGSAGSYASVGVASTLWFTNYLNDPELIYGLSPNGIAPIMIAPPDFSYGSTAPSAYVAGVTRGQYELVKGMFTGGNQFIVLSREYSGSTSPAGTTWPAGSYIAVRPGSQGTGYGTLRLADMHANAMNDILDHNWAVGCDDQSTTGNVCGEYILGSIINEIGSYSTGQAAGQAGMRGASVLFIANEPWNAGHNQGVEPLGEGFAKSVGIGGSVDVIDSLGGGGVGYGNEAASGQLYANGFVNVTSFDGSTPFGTYRNFGTGTWWSTDVQGYGFNSGSGTVAIESPRLPTAPGSPSGADIGMQFQNSYCYWDTSPSDGGHPTSRWCYQGGPLSPGTKGGFEFDTWSGSSWVQQFGLSPSSSGAANLTVSGNASIAGDLSAGEINGEITVDGSTYKSLNSAWGAAVADANSSGQNQTIRLGPGEFNVTATLNEPSNGACVSLIGSAGSATAADTTNASTTLNVSANLNGPIFYAGNTAQAQGCTFRNLNILGNQNATYGFEMEWFRGLMMGTVTVNDTSDAAILLGEESTAGGHQSNFLMRNVTVSYSSAKFTPANRPAYGIHLLKTAIDSYMDDIFVRNALTASVYNEGAGNTGNMIHGFGYPYTCTTAPCANNAASATAPNASYATSYVVYDTGGGGTVWNDTYIDSPAVAGFYIGANGVSIDGGHIQWPDLASFPSANLAYVASGVTNNLLIADVSCLGMNSSANWITYGGPSGNPPSFSGVHHLTGCGNYYQALEPAVTTGFSSGGANINDPSGAVPRVWATPLSGAANNTAYSAQMYNGYEGDAFQAHFSGVSPFFNLTYRGTVRTDGGLAVSTVINTASTLSLTTANKNVIANAASGPQTLTLPSCYTAMPDRMKPTGLELTIIKSDSSSNAVTLQTVSSQVIDYNGNSSQTLAITSPGARNLICGPDDNWYAY